MPEKHYARFKVTGAKPVEVEGAMQQGWKLVNCSLSMRPDPNFGMHSVIAGEHCYFEGDEHVGDGDAGATQP